MRIRAQRYLEVIDAGGIDHRDGTTVEMAGNTRIHRFLVVWFEIILLVIGVGHWSCFRNVPTIRQLRLQCVGMLASAAASRGQELILVNKINATGSQHVLCPDWRRRGRTGHAQPRIGPGQRRLLTLVQNPIAVDELAERHRLDPDKLARDLARLADLKLVVLQGPSIAPAPQPRAGAPVAMESDAAMMTPIVIGRSPGRSPSLPLAAGLATLVLATGAWYGTRVGSAPAETPTPNASPALAEVAPVPAPTIGNAADTVTAEASPTPCAGPGAARKRETGCRAPGQPF